jgi:hypothetical protein
MKKYQHLPAIPRRAQQRITGSAGTGPFYCWTQQGRILISNKFCEPSRCCNIQGAYGYSCGSIFALPLDVCIEPF